MNKKKKDDHPKVIFLRTQDAVANTTRTQFNFIIPPSSMLHIRKKSYLRVGSVAFIVGTAYVSSSVDVIKISGLDYNPSTYISSDRGSPIICAYNPSVVNGIQLRTFRLELTPQIIHNISLEVGDRTDVGLDAGENLQICLVIEEDTD